MLVGYSPAYSAILGMVTCIAVSWLVWFTGGTARA